MKSFLQVEHMFVFQFKNDFFVNILCFMTLKIIELDETEDSFLDVRFMLQLIELRQT